MSKKEFDLDNYKNNTTKNLIITASAGTGKTYSITGIIKELILKGLNLKNLLVVTYTEKAAGELKDRIRKIIEEIIKDGKLIENLDVDDCFIGTIHGFCKKINDEYGISLNLPLNLKLISDVEFTSFINDFIRKGDIATDISIIAKIKGKINIDNLIKWFKNAINKYYLDFNYEEDMKIISFTGLNQDADYKKYENFKPLFLNNINDLDDLKKEQFPDFFNHYNNLKNSEIPDAKDLADLLNKHFKDEYNFDLKKGFKSSLANSECKEDYNYFYELKKGFDTNKALVYKYLKDLYISWQEYKSRNKLQTFDDMIRNIYEFTKDQNSPIVLELKKKYKIGIIDEFQDTNQKQYSIFKTIFLTDKDHQLIVVGDNKQSIYSFQGADVSVFDNAIKEMSENNDATNEELKKNYRSSEEIVKSCNKLFSYNEFGFNNETRKIFMPVNACKEDDKKYFFTKYKNNKIDKPFYINSKKCKEEHYPLYVAKQIIDFCTYINNDETNLMLYSYDKQEIKNITTFKDIAVLAKSKSEMDYICYTFKKIGIPFIKYKDDQLYVSNECYNWIVLLEAINEIDFTGSKRATFKKALFTDFFNISLENLNDEKSNTNSSTEMELINHWQKLVNNKNWEQLISSIIYKSNLIQNLNSLSHMHSLNIYKQLGQSCLDYLNKNNSIELLIKNLKQLSNGNIEDDENGAIIAKGTDFNAVQVMTIHASKGLEFPIVIAVAGFKDKNYNVPKIFNLRTKDGPKLTFENTEVPNSDDEEVRRLFYVCYTRSKYICFLPNYESFGNQCKNIIARPIEKLINENQFTNLDTSRVNINELKNSLAEILKHQKSESTDDFKNCENNNKELIRNKNNHTTYKHSYSSLAHHNEEPVDDELFNEDNDNIDKERNSDDELINIDTKNIIQVGSAYNSKINVDEDYSKIVKGKYGGNALHEVFENTDFTKEGSTISDDQIAIIFKKQRIIVDDEQIKIVKDIIKNTLNAKIPCIKGSNVIKENYFTLSEISNENKKAEIEFNFNMVNKKLANYCNGFMDLVIKRGDIYSVLDYKTDSLNDEFTSYSNLDSLKNQVDKRYSIQRVLYSYTLIKYFSTVLNKSMEEIFNNNFGGVHYIFLRGTSSNTGNGIYSHTWKSFDDLENSYQEILNMNNIK